MMTLAMLLLLAALSGWTGWMIRDTQADIADGRRWNNGCRCDYQDPHAPDGAS